jgi:predicted transposase/invertase (TIGR01784 family)
MCKYNPKIDLVFRKLFGSEENKDILLSFVNAILQKEHKLTDLTIKNPYNLASYIASKNSILDIKAVDEFGNYYDIEMQISEQGFYGKRALYYLDKMFVEQLDRSEDYSKLNGVIGIHLLDFPYFKDDRYKRRFVWKDAETNDESKFLAYQELYFIEMCKFNKEYKQLSDVLDRWITFLNKAYEFDKKNIPPELAKETEISKAIDKLEQFYFDAQEKEIYDGERKFRLCMNEERRTAEEKGKAEGLAEGEYKKAITIAKEMLLDGMSAEKVAKFTGLAVDQIEALSQM